MDSKHQLSTRAINKKYQVHYVKCYKVILLIGQSEK
jgi:hypothetical protein